MTRAHLYLAAAKLRRLADVLETNAPVADDMPPEAVAAVNATIVMDILCGELFDFARTGEGDRLSELADHVIAWVHERFGYAVTIQEKA